MSSSTYLERKLSESGNIFKLVGKSQFHSDIYMRRLNSYSSRYKRFGRNLYRFDPQSSFEELIYWKIEATKNRNRHPIAYQEKVKKEHDTFMEWYNQEYWVICGTTEEDNAPYEYRLKNSHYEP